MKFNQCPVCLSEPESFDQDPVYVDWPGGIVEHIKTVVKVQFGCHKLMNIANCGSDFKKDFEGIKQWETRSTL